MLQKITFIFIGLTCFLGIWHAFPMLNVVNDEMYFVGGVLRAMESHTLIPAIDDVPYGTITYLLSYGTTAITLAVLLPFFGFSFAGLKLFLVQEPWVMYLSLRFFSACLSLVFLFYIYKLLKKECTDMRVRVLLLLLLFGNIITTVILHTGKMWVVSMLLVVISFYYLHETVSAETTTDAKTQKRNLFLSIIFAFLAFANFPLNIFSLINIPILVFYFRKDSVVLKRLGFYVLVGLVIFLFITLLNFPSIENQINSIFTVYHPVQEGVFHKLNILQSLGIYAVKLVLLFPLLILTLVLSAKAGIKNMRLFTISVIYFATYFLLISIVANWTMELEASLRYLFPLGFFLIFMITGLNIKYKNIFSIILILSLIYHAFTLYYLSVPTTYNNAYNWVRTELSDKEATIVNNVVELQLPANKKTALSVESIFCATKCQNIITFDLNQDFKPYVIDEKSSYSTSTNIQGELYVISDTHMDGMTLVKSFENPTEKNHSVDYNMGSYFDLGFFKMHNLGKNMYIYKRE